MIAGIPKTGGRAGRPGGTVPRTRFEGRGPRTRVLLRPGEGERGAGIALGKRTEPTDRRRRPRRVGTPSSNALVPMAATPPAPGCETWPRGTLEIGLDLPPVKAGPVQISVPPRRDIEKHVAYRARTPRRQWPHGLIGTRGRGRGGSSCPRGCSRVPHRERNACGTRGLATAERAATWWRGSRCAARARPRPRRRCARWPSRDW